MPRIYMLSLINGGGGGKGWLTLELRIYKLPTLPREFELLMENVSPPPPPRIQAVI